jgi:hypothetical protein
MSPKKRACAKKVDKMSRGSSPSNFIKVMFFVAPTCQARNSVSSKNCSSKKPSRHNFFKTATDGRNFDKISTLKDTLKDKKSALKEAKKAAKNASN